MEEGMRFRSHPPHSRLISRSLQLLTLLVLSLPGWPQAHEIQGHLNLTYKGNQFLLCNFYVGNKLSYDGDGLLRSGNNVSGPWTLAGIEVTQIEVGANGLEIKGKRLGIYFSDEKQRSAPVGKITIHVLRPVSHEDLETAFDATLEKIFIRLGQEDLRPVLPAHWKVCLSGKDLESREAAWDTALSESKVALLRIKDFPAGQLTLPKVLFGPDPQYTEPARSRQLQGSSVLGVVVDATGKPITAAILRPLGMGLDEAALLAVSRWKFEPGVLNGKPVPVRTTIEMGFRLW